MELEKCRRKITPWKLASGSLEQFTSICHKLAEEELHLTKLHEENAFKRFGVAMTHQGTKAAEYSAYTYNLADDSQTDRNQYGPVASALDAINMEIVAEDMEVTREDFQASHNVVHAKTA